MMKVIEKNEIIKNRVIELLQPTISLQAPENTNTNSEDSDMKEEEEEEKQLLNDEGSTYIAAPTEAVAPNVTRRNRLILLEEKGTVKITKALEVLSTRSLGAYSNIDSIKFKFNFDCDEKDAEMWRSWLTDFSRINYAGTKMEFAGQVVRASSSVIYCMLDKILKNTNKPLHQQIMKEFKKEVHPARQAIKNMKCLGTRFAILIEEFGIGCLCLLSCVTAGRIIDASKKAFAHFVIHLRSIKNTSPINQCGTISFHDDFLQSFASFYVKYKQIVYYFIYKKNLCNCLMWLEY